MSDAHWIIIGGFLGAAGAATVLAFVTRNKKSPGWLVRG